MEQFRIFFTNGSYINITADEMCAYADEVYFKKNGNVTYKFFANSIAGYERVITENVIPEDPDIKSVESLN